MVVVRKEEKVRVDVVHEGLHAVGELGRVGLQIAYENRVQEGVSEAAQGRPRAKGMVYLACRAPLSASCTGGAQMVVVRVSGGESKHTHREGGLRASRRC